MNSEQEHSEIGQQNVLIFHSQQPEHPPTKYTTFNDIKKLESQPPNPEPSQTHIDCRPTYLKWDITKSQLPPNIKVSPYNNCEWIIEQRINLCCLSMRLEIKFKLKRNSNIEVGRYRVRNGVYEEEGLRYVIENRVTTLGIKICLIKDKTLKIWKQIETPILSYETQTHNTVTIKQSTNGDICVTLNDFQFMMSLSMGQVPGLIPNYSTQVQYTKQYQHHHQPPSKTHKQQPQHPTKSTQNKPPNTYRSPARSSLFKSQNAITWIFDRYDMYLASMFVLDLLFVEVGLIGRCLAGWFVGGYWVLWWLVGGMFVLYTPGLYLLIRSQNNIQGICLEQTADPRQDEDRGGCNQGSCLIF